ncbi:MAG: S9 family peptidase, partial [Flavobacteriia bacterium]
EHQHDSAWIGGPGISSWNFETGTLGWLKDAKVIYFQSEQSGYSHLYTLDLQTKTKLALTSGNYEVHEVRLSKDSSSFWLSTNMNHPGTRSFHQLDLKTLKMKPLLAEQGAYEVQLSPDEKQLAYRFSTSTQPWEIFTCSLKNPKDQVQITTSTTEIFSTYPWQKPEILSFKASDGVEVYARMYTPKAKNKNGAAVLFVHGAGYLQNAHHYWSYYQREFMFHQMLIEKGYTVLDVDYRASEGYGRNYRTAIYRHMGGRDLQDFVDAKQFLVSQYGIDSNRVGIYGGSYGGFITLMGLFTEPGTFACGAALRSVTDWAHYNHEYTTNILNTPTADPEAYRQSSPIHFAEGLQDPLLILHGMIDDNVQFQDVVRLNQRLIELGKKDWWMALYPVERHGFQYTSSWTDEYRRILELFDTYLLK